MISGIVLAVAHQLNVIAVPLLTDKTNNPLRLAFWRKAQGVPSNHEGYHAFEKIVINQRYSTNHLYNTTLKVDSGSRRGRDALAPIWTA